MSGRYTYRVGTQATVIRADVPFGVPLDNTFLPQNLKDAGYRTAMYGKWVSGSLTLFGIVVSYCMRL